MVIHMIETLTQSEILDVAKICDLEGIDEVFQIRDNKGGTYWQGPAHGKMHKFTIERADADSV